MSKGERSPFPMAAPQPPLNVACSNPRHAQAGSPNSRAGEILHDAACIVDGVRVATHGSDKERSFQAIAGLWDAYLAARQNGRAGLLVAADVAAMMVLLKLARSEQGVHISDHGVDAAGYAAIWGELRESSETQMALPL